MKKSEFELEKTIGGLTRSRAWLFCTYANQQKRLW